MKILYAIPGLYRVGDYLRCLGFAEALASRGHYVTLMVGERALRLWVGKVKLNGVKHIVMPYFGELSIAERIFEAQPDTKLPMDTLLRSAWVALNAKRFDIVHVFHIGMNSLIPFLVSRYAAPNTVCIQDWCDLWEGGILRPGRSSVGKLDYWLSTAVERWQVRVAKEITVNSEHLASVAKHAYGKRDSHVSKVIEGADLEGIRPMSRHVCRKMLGLQDGCPWIGFAAFFNPDSDLLIETLRCLTQFGTAPFRILWIGPVDQQLASRIASAELDHVVTRAGVVARDQMSLYLGACDLFVMPFMDKVVNRSRWPAKFGDYLAAGRPVVSNPIGEIARFFERYPTIGVLAKPEPTAFAHAIGQVLFDEVFIEKSGLAARRAAEESLSWSDAAERMEAFYRRITERIIGPDDPCMGPNDL